MSMIKNAEWIRSKRDYGDVCPVFKREFACDKEVKSAFLHITAMGVYEAFLNGSRIGDFIMAPGWTAYDKRHQYQSYDITEMLEGDNLLTVTVGKGWYRGELVTWRAKDIWGGFSALIAALEIEYTNGSRDVLLSDRKWHTAESNIRFSSVYDGEVFDASFSPADWEQAVVLRASKDPLIPQEGERVCEQEIILPKDIIHTPKGETVIDFGQNITGYIAFEANAKSGDIIAYTHAEILDANGNFYTDNLRSAKQRVEYICKEGNQCYKPHHTFMGFRYIRLDEAPEYISPECFKAVVVHSNIRRTGFFECSNPKLNKLFSNVLWGQRDNFLDIPTDCPQRDERLGWTGDAQIFVRTAAYNFNVQRFFKKWLRDLAASQRYDGGVPVVIPDVIDVDEANPRAAWGDAAVICPWQIYLVYGDTEVLEEQLESMKAWVEYMHSRGSEEFLWCGDQQFADWLGLDAPFGSYKGSSDDDLIASAYFAYSTGIFAKALKALGKDASYYEKLYENIVSAFRERFCEYKTQTECAVALYFGLAQDECAVAEKLAKMVESNGNKLTTGFVGTPYLLFALSENGYTDVAYSLLLQEEYPSWLFSVNMGATTVWEHWDGLKADGSMWSEDMNSFNHYAYGSVASWMYETVAGIRIDEAAPGFKNVILCPKPDKRLEWAGAAVETEHGTVSSKWRYSGDEVEYEFEVPVSATLILNGKEIRLNAGKHKFKQ